MNGSIPPERQTIFIRFILVFTYVVPTYLGETESFKKKKKCIIESSFLKIKTQNVQFATCNITRCNIPRSSGMVRHSILRTCTVETVFAHGSTGCRRYGRRLEILTRPLSLRTSLSQRFASEFDAQQLHMRGRKLIIRSL